MSDKSEVAGRVLGDYVFESTLGQGGMGAVYLATHQKLNRKVAIKILSAELATSEEYVSRFLQEARVVNDVRHPNIVDITDFMDIKTPRTVAYVMEYLQGAPLSNSIREHGPFTMVQAFNIIGQLIAALTAVHELGVVHRDLKPDNVFITGDRTTTDLAHIPSVKLLDFGIAKSSEGSGTHKTATGLMLGTPAYMAPEQVAAAPVSAATDVYALGEILYEVVTGKRVYKGKQLQILKAKLTGEVPDLFIPDGIPYSEELTELVRRCVSVAPEGRPSMAELADKIEHMKSNLHTQLEADPDTMSALSASLRTGPVNTPEPTPYSMASMAVPAPTITSPSRNWLWLGVAALVLAVGGAAVAKRLSVDSHPLVESVATPEVPPATPVPAAVAEAEPVEEKPTEEEPPAEEKPVAVVEASKPEPPPPPTTTRRRSWRIDLESRPSGAEVIDVANGKVLGRTPTTLTLASRRSRKKIRFKLDGFESTQLTVGKRRSVSVSLARRAAAPAVTKTTTPKKEKPKVVKKRELRSW